MSERKMDQKGSKRGWLCLAGVLNHRSMGYKQRNVPVELPIRFAIGRKPYLIRGRDDVVPDETEPDQEIETGKLKMTFASGTELLESWVAHGGTR
jgi:hypothetical protein